MKPKIKCPKCSQKGDFYKGKTACISCTKAAVRKYRTGKIKAGKCHICTAPAVIKAVCLRHWIAKALYRKVPPEVTRYTRDYDLEMALVALLKSTKYCPYTQERLVVGKNVHLDHKIPVSKDVNKIFAIKNLQWTSRRYNMAKSNMTDAEFLRFCRKIVRIADAKISGRK